MSFWDSISEAAGETWDVVNDVGGAWLTSQVQDTKESGRDKEKLRESEPVKGTSADGSPIVVQQPASQPNQPQYIQGVDNTVLLVGSGLVVALLLVLARGR